MSNDICKSLKNRQVIAQNNKIINSKYTLDITEQRLILLAISQIDSKNDTQFHKFNCTVKELEKKLQTTLHETRLKELAIGILKKPFFIKNKKGWTALNWFSSISYIEGEARLEFKISDDLVPYLLQLKDNFTKIELKQAIQFHGKYTTRFYQFLMQVKNQEKKEVKFNLQELYELLQLPKSLRDYSKFRQYVLEPSIKEINQKTNIKAKFEPIKTGRKYTDLILSWEYKAKSQNQTKKARATKDFDKYIGKLVEYQGRIIEIDQVRETTEQETGDIRKICVIYNARQNISRVDFENIDHLEINIKRAEKMLKENPNLKEVKDDKSKEIAELFAKLDKFN